MKIAILSSGNLGFKRHVWKRLPEPEIQFDKIEKREKEILSLLRDVFWSHDVQSLAGGALLHRHYDIPDTALLVERFQGRRSITKAEEFVPLGARVVPHLWKLDKDERGNVEAVPMEFIVADEETPDFEAAASALIANKPFLSELYDTLDHLGVLDIIGLQLVHRDSLRVEGGQLIEMTSHSSSASIITSESFHDVASVTARIVPTFFPFGKMVGEQKADTCSSHGWDFCSRSGNSCCCGSGSDD